MKLELLKKLLAESDDSIYADSPGWAEAEERRRQQALPKQVTPEQAERRRQEMEQSEVRGRENAEIEAFGKDLNIIYQAVLAHNRKAGQAKLDFNALTRGIYMDVHDSSDPYSYAKQFVVFPEKSGGVEAVRAKIEALKNDPVLSNYIRR